jgi:hypothetical protein
MVMQAPDLRDFPDETELGRLRCARRGCVHGECTMRAPTVIIGQVAHEDAPEVIFMQNDHVVQTFTTDAPDEALDIWVLPGTSRSNDHVFHTHVPYTLSKGDTIDAVTIA